MAAFISSLLVLIVGTAICFVVARKRPAGTPLSWGEAFISGTFVFALMFVAYGNVPHQWLDFADNELLWRPDRILMGISSEGVKFGDDGKAIGGSGRILVSYQAIRDIVASLLYIIFLVVHVWLWSVWQKRGTPKQEVEPTSRFGRPLIRKA
ncbi:MAG: hypothetical protein M3314_12375 [Actinomycetota bacterium]|nr:hypothetical protein [Actinomycetota bacterium]